tara:strand:+ start:682 stop:852 length:171 start_codon:yes stop_codon:yes gene_type:complete
MNKWVLSLFAVFSLFVVIFVNLNNNSDANIRTNTELDNVSNEEMELVIEENPISSP